MKSEILTRQFICLIITNFCYWASLDAFMPVLPQYYDKMGFSGFEVGLVIGSVSAAGLLLRVIAGKAVDRYGAAPLVGIGLLFTLTAIAGYLFATSLAAAVFCAFLQGVGLACYSGAALTMATLMFSELHTTEVFAWYSLFGMLGGSLSMAGANYVYHLGGLPMVVVVGGGAALTALLLFPKRPTIRVGMVSSNTLPIKAIAVHPGVYLPTLSLLSTSLCFGGALTFLPLFMLSRGFVDVTIFFASYAGAVIITRFLLRRIIALAAPERLTLIAVLLMGTMMCLATVVYSTFLLGICGLLMGLALGMAFPVMGTIVSTSTDPVNRGTAFGFFATAADLGFIIGSAGFGFAAAFIGYDGVFLLGGAYTLSYAFVYWFWLEKKITGLSDSSA